MSNELKRKDRLSALDASFLALEHTNTHMHAGAFLIFDGQPPEYSQFAAYIESRLHLAPRFRQKLAFPPFGVARPIWIDDVNFNIHHHVQQADLPHPGSEKELQELAGQIFSKQFDRTRPLWEFSLVRGLSENRFAVIWKIHHSLIDGVSGVNLLTVLFSLESAPKATEPQDQHWIPHPEQSGMEMIIDGVKEQLQKIQSTLRSMVGAAKHPLDVFRNIVETMGGLREVAHALFFNPAPDTYLNVRIGPNRRIEWVKFDFEQLKQVQNAAGGTVNDVVLAVVAAALAKFSHRRGQRTEGLKLFSMVPVSTRAAGDCSLFGGSTTVIRSPLPLDVKDPIQLLRDVRRGMVEVKESGQITGTKAISDINDFLPPILLDQTSRLNFSTRLFNLIVTNMHGPQTPLYLLGRPLLDLRAITLLPKRHALAIAVISFRDSINFSFIADPDVLPDLQMLREDTERAFAELHQAATGEAKPSFDGDDDKKTPQTGSSENPSRSPW